MGIEPTGDTKGASVAVLKTGQTTRPDPPPLCSPLTAHRLTATTSISTRTFRGRPAAATVDRAGRWSPNHLA